ncbi:MAG: family 20 glycosylhydrolase [Bacteroidales bacterium]
MKNLLVLFLMLFSSRMHAQPVSINLIPKPAEMQVMAGFINFNKGTSVSINRAEAADVATQFVKQWNTATGYAAKVSLGTKGTIRFNLLETADPKLGDEGYTLVSGSGYVTVSANREAGLFYGMQTLLQLFPPAILSSVPVMESWTVPCVQITDYPRFGWRGLMLDCSRHFFTKEEVKKYIDQMVVYKYNVFHWHLTDDNGWRIEIKSLPRLTSVGAWRVERAGAFGDRPDPKPGEPASYGGFYTQDDIREIVAYASQRHVTIVPEIDVPGHSMALLAAYPELSCTKDTNVRVNPGTNFAEWYGDGKFRMFIDNTLNPSDEKVYGMLDKIVTEVAALFPGEYIHMGGDECYKGFWEKDAGCQELMKKLAYTHVEQLQGYFVNRVEQIVRSKGKRLIGWDEILEGGISPGATVMSWRGMKSGIEAAKLGHAVVMTPTNYVYLDYQQGEASIESPVYAALRIKTCYSFDPVPEGVDAKYILGGQGNLWTEQIPVLNYAEYMTYPRAWALAEVYWSPANGRSWDEFVPRMENHMLRSDIRGVNYSRAAFDVVVDAVRKDNQVEISLSTEIPGLDIYYTIDGTMPGEYSPRYTGPFILPEGKISLKAISYRGDKAAGNLIYLRPEDLMKRAGN